jgi:hypothetical protein
MKSVTGRQPEQAGAKAVLFPGGQRGLGDRWLGVVVPFGFYEVGEPSGTCWRSLVGTMCPDLLAALASRYPPQQPCLHLHARARTTEQAAGHCPLALQAPSPLSDDQLHGSRSTSWCSGGLAVPVLPCSCRHRTRQRTEHSPFSRPLHVGSRPAGGAAA